MSEQHPWAHVDFSKQPFGDVLAKATAAKLKEGFELYRCHRDYCGHGLTYDSAAQAFVFGTVFDGMALEVIKKFQSEGDFVQWLAQQSDWTMAGADDTSDLFVPMGFGRGNQTLNEASLRSFLEATSNPCSERVRIVERA